jgi:hypothetical protein
MSQGTSGPPRVALPEGVADNGVSGWVPLELNISTELDELLRELARQNNHTVEDILVRAVALYHLLSQQARAGKRVGVAREGQELETEIKGF